MISTCRLWWPNFCKMFEKTASKTCHQIDREKTPWKSPNGVCLWRFRLRRWRQEPSSPSSPHSVFILRLGTCVATLHHSHPINLVMVRNPTLTTMCKALHHLSAQNWVLLGYAIKSRCTKLNFMGEKITTTLGKKETLLRANKYGIYNNKPPVMDWRKNASSRERSSEIVKGTWLISVKKHVGWYPFQSPTMSLFSKRVWKFFLSSTLENSEFSSPTHSQNISIPRNLNKCHTVVHSTISVRWNVLGSHTWLNCLKIRPTQRVVLGWSTSSGLGGLRQFFDFSRMVKKWFWIW